AKPRKSDARQFNCRCSSRVFDNNPGAYYCYKAAGFKEMGKEITMEILGEQWKDIEMEITR
ncbi:MAG: hypothetical protein MJ126_08920, partial [Lachnospiraceae bacterium]|nr:hypothetical protein [Lachnospiraceae bacterium]